MSLSTVFRILGWIFFGFIYLSIVIGSFGLMLILLIPLFLLSHHAYKLDLKREKKETDNFKDNNLFFRYGYRINRTVFSIPIDTNWSDGKIDDFAAEMSQTIAVKTHERLKHPTVYLVTILDKKLKSDSKNFLKMVFRTKRGSQLSHFVYYAVSGKSIVAHYFTYVRGTYQWYDVFNFVFFCPISIWFWSIPWINNQFSIISSISTTIDNSFDVIDLSTFYESSYYALLDETRIILKENGLLTEELAQVIFNNINNNNSQNVNINNSSGLNLGNISNFVQSSVKKT